MSKPASPRYRTTNWKEYKTALKSRGSLLIWLDKEMRWQGSANGKQDRRPKFSDAAIQFCLTIKCLFNLAQSLLKLAGLDGRWRISAP